MMITEDFEFYDAEEYYPQEPHITTLRSVPSVEMLEQLIYEKHYSYDKLVAALARAQYVVRTRNLNEYL